MTLADVLARSQHILLDFDGPMCATFSAVSNAEATRQLGELLACHEVRVPIHLLDAADPFALLYYRLRVHSATPGTSGQESALHGMETGWSAFLPDLGGV
jgi:hypothetical protein